MPDSATLIAVPADTRRFENYEWHAAPSTYLAAIMATAGGVPVIVPALADEAAVDVVLDRVDGVLVTGSASNVHPSRYGVEPTPAHEPFDPARDRLTETMIRRAIAREIPLLAICRGHQELNVALGGSLATEIQEFEGRMDHRAPTHPEQDGRFALRHPVAVEPGGRLAAIVGAETVEVNSLHRQAIDRLADGLTVEARAPDGTVEAVSVTGADGFALGLQWHPEYWAASDPASRAIFQAFGEAARQYRKAR
ncbi:gamma-glutamyl-gamma-aminobutyrate hydrolase family protein [uncultured Aureimonas sp.]|uniref:gamma-glutamyl-gamma-aminobutyrate hydrolase family protein n=1 Tax=uncultured Aureimonas sp. TaxID=1604662 RepID=UPI0025D2813D|nr:gamma-glutamyl-gamma-aminobutyrate hydrolase family protein [uncultured Aureimonas sp.]